MEALVLILCDPQLLMLARNLGGYLYLWLGL